MGIICANKNEKLSISPKKFPPSLMRSETGHFFSSVNHPISKGEIYFSKKGDEYERIMGPMEIMGGLQSIEIFLSLENLDFDLEKKLKIKASICNNKMSDVYNFLGETEYLNGVKIISDKYHPADPNDRSSRNIHFKSNVILYKKLAIYDGELTDEQIIAISNELLRGDI